MIIIFIYLIYFYFDIFKLIVEWTLITGVENQLESFKEGFESILSTSCLKQFYPEEVSLISGFFSTISIIYSIFYL